MVLPVLPRMEGGTVAQRKPTDDDSTDAPDGPDAASTASSAGGDLADDDTQPTSQDDAAGAAAGAAAADPALAAAPLEPPSRPRRDYAAPPGGLAPSAVPLEPTGRQVTVVDHAGDPLDPDDLFDDPGPHTTYLVTRKRIYRQYSHENAPNSTATQLLYPHGARVPRDQAEALRHSVRTAATG